MSDAAATLRAHGRQPDAQLIQNGRGANCSCPMVRAAPAKGRMHARCRKPP